MGHRILVVDDEQVFLDSVGRGLAMSGYRNLRLERDPKEAAALFERGESYDVALIDVNMPAMNGMQLLELIKHHSPNTECIMVTALNEASAAVECLKKGAYDYLVKPFSRDNLKVRIDHALEKKRLREILHLTKSDVSPQLSNAQAFQEIMTRSLAIKKILKEAELHARSNVPVLITGESGTGKELLARAIHRASPRAGFPFTPVNMASLTESLFEGEFFGHTRGAFTGADKDRAGYLAHTHRGTLFLDEVGLLPINLQGKLLRVLEEGEFIKLGSSATQTVDIRFIAATNQDLDRLVAKGLFRKDLYYRLKGAWLHLPPLHERREDIPLLVGKFLEEFQGTDETAGIEESAMAALTGYDYPGNIRELRSIVQVAVNLAQGAAIARQHLPSRLRRHTLPRTATKEAAPPLSLAELEKTHTLKIYLQSGRNKSQTAKVLGIGLNTLRRKLESYGVD